MNKKNLIEYRTVTEKERLLASFLQFDCFADGHNDDEIRRLIKKGERYPENTYAAINEAGRMLSCVEVYPFDMYFDGQIVKMFGIGLVASAVENRRQGNIRHIYKKIFDDTYEQGYVFSHLYPFSHDYYRKFGYEQIGGATKYTLPLDCARKFKNVGNITRLTAKADSSVRDAIINVYEKYASKFNAMVSRSDEHWDEILDVSENSGERFYYWMDEKGVIKSYVKFKRDRDTIAISQIAWLCNESMLGILQFIGMFDGSAGEMDFIADPLFNAEIYFSILYKIKTQKHWLGMSRVVNARRALELCKKPNGKGRLVFKVTDEFLSWNNHTYAVEYDGENCEVSITDGIAADIEVSEKALVQMLLGVYDFSLTSQREDVIINGNVDLLGCVFCKKDIFLTERF